MNVEYTKALNRAKEEADHDEDLFAFKNLTSLEAQMASLKTKGFLRSYKAYQPPADLERRFVSVCSEALGIPVTKDSLDSVQLDNLDKKTQLLKALHIEFDHLVHSSRLHEMKTLGRLFLFYSSEVCNLNPYEQLHRDKEADLLPSNLVIQKEAFRFTGQGDHTLDQVGQYQKYSCGAPVCSGLRIPKVGHPGHWSQSSGEVCIATCKALAMGGTRLQITQFTCIIIQSLLQSDMFGDAPSD